MSIDEPHILTVNAGSSSIKFDLFTPGDRPRRNIEGVIEKIGEPEANLIIKDTAQSASSSKPVHAPDHAAAAKILMDWLEQSLPQELLAIGHRIVHGGPNYAQPCMITSEVLAELRRLVDFDPEHLPTELNLIESLQRLFPNTPQVACFDTAFHHDLPSEARLLPLPRRYSEQGLRRYGFHGLSYSFLVQELKHMDEQTAASSRVILAHLGNGVSLAAVHQGKSIDTTMGLTPAGGVPMSSRSGDLDPGVLSYLARVEKLDAAAFDHLINFESGLLGMSGSSADMQELLERENHDDQAAEAIAVFCYQIKKAIGGLAAALGGLDQLVFTGGMGENAPKIRARICEGLEFLGVSLDNSRNSNNAGLISADNSRVVVRTIHTDEAQIIANNTADILDSSAHIEAKQGAIK